MQRPNRIQFASTADHSSHALTLVPTPGSTLSAPQTKEYQVAELLPERIIAGSFARGQRLKQAEIAKMLNISITPVREALLTLEAEGYVRGLPHKACWCRSSTQT